MIIRDAASDDADAIAQIYNDAVEHTTAIWNETTVDAANRAAWIAERQASGHAVLVATVEGTVVGYAAYGDWRAFDGYRHTVEHSIYVRGDQRGGGIGRALLTELIERARRGGKHVMVAGIESGNLGSIRLHERLGFAQVGHLPHVGTKFGRWLDLTFLHLRLDARPAPDA